MSKHPKLIFCYWDDCHFINEGNKKKYKIVKNEKPKDNSDREKDPDTGKKT